MLQHMLLSVVRKQPHEAVLSVSVLFHAHGVYGFCDMMNKPRVLNASKISAPDSTMNDGGG